MLGEEGRRRYVLIKDFNTFMYDYRLHLGGKQFCYYSLQVFSTEEILKRHIKDVILKIALKLMVNKLLKSLRKVNMLKSKILKEK